MLRRAITKRTWPECDQPTTYYWFEVGEDEWLETSKLVETQEEVDYMLKKAAGTTYPNAKPGEKSGVYPIRATTGYIRQAADHYWNGQGERTTFLEPI